MQIGIIGLGRMGGNITRRLMKIFDANAKPREALAKEGVTAVRSLEDMVKALGEKPRAVWVMLPAGRITEETVERLGGLLEPDDMRQKGDSRAERGYIHAGPSGAGHFVKMVHNGIEYGLS
jgi:6-phosphogluconate dehydrogenase